MFHEIHLLYKFKYILSQSSSTGPVLKIRKVDRIVGCNRTGPMSASDIKKWILVAERS